MMQISSPTKRTVEQKTGSQNSNIKLHAKLKKTLIVSHNNTYYGKDE
jgi:hypothetical protein